MIPSRKLAAVLGLGLALSSGFSAVGCSRQGEGQRCSLLNGNADCNDDGLTLICIPASSLQNSDIDRCCEKDLTYSVSTCAPRRISGSGGEGGESAEGGSAGDMAAGGASGGTSAGLGNNCNYNSQCPENLICGPTGKCQYECLETRDCKDGLICNEEKNCVTASSP